MGAAALTTAHARLRRGSLAVRWERATVLVVGMMVAHATLLSYLAIQRHRAFWSARYDVGNMVQAVWTTAHGHLLLSTDTAGRQISRLASHVDPILAVFAPIFRIWPNPEILLVSQVAAVSLGALPVYWLGRRVLGDVRLAAAGAAVWLLYPPLQWDVITEFHAVAFAAPLLAYAIWAAWERRTVTLAVAAVAALMCKENVGLALAVLGIWMIVHQRRRYAGGILAAASAAWAFVAALVVIPHFRGGQSAFVGRYGELGASPGEIARTLVTRPWHALAVMATEHRATYLLALLLPLALLPLAAPLLAAGALPDLLLNLLSGWWPQYSIEYQYTAVMAPFLVMGAIVGLGRLRAHGRIAWLRATLGRPRVAAAVLIAPVATALVLFSPLPWFATVSQAAPDRLQQYHVGAHAQALARAVALVPDGVPVAVTNNVGAHLSARERVYSFPVLGNASWVVVDRQRPSIAFQVEPTMFRRALDRLLAEPGARVVFSEDGAMVIRRAL